MKPRYVIGIVCLCLILSAIAGFVVIDRQHKDAYQTLVTAKGFFYSSIGITGSDMPESVHAFKNLYFSSRAKDYFLQLANEGTDAGKLYALCGLYHLDKQAFNTLIEECQYITTSIPGGSGCRAYNTPMDQIILSITPPEYDILHGKIPQELLTYISN